MTAINKVVCDACGDSPPSTSWAEILVDRGQGPALLAHVCEECRCAPSIEEDYALRLGNVILLNLVKRK